MEYSFTVTKDYVKAWTYIEAIRELLQNAYDYGNEVIEIDRDDMSISITNHDDILDIKTLLLGYGTKFNDGDQVGGFGEGFLLALLVLLREDFGVIIHNGNEYWKPYFKYNEEFKEELLYIKVTPEKVSGNDLINRDFNVYVDGFDNYQLDKIEQTFLKLGNKYNSIQTEYGEILLDPCQKGKMYVEGLPITSDESYMYGYNFKSFCVKLDRDRKEINTYELKRITSQSLLYMDEYDFDLIDDLICKGGSDANYIINQSLSFPDEFKYGYSSFLKHKYNIDEDAVVTTETNTSVVDELVEMGEKVVTVQKKIQADVINDTTDYSANKLQIASDNVHSRDKKEEAYVEYNRSEYKELKEWYKKYCEDLSDEAKEEFDDILTNLRPFGFHLIENEIGGD